MPTARGGREQAAGAPARPGRHTRLGLPAIVHEECLTTTLGAPVYPAFLASAATFDPALVERMARTSGADLTTVGVHQQ
ncbi:hypothetical protein FGD71_016420 [Streptomyces sporangiiformans]|uniref:Uncharacterized protein n=1 Tax=Streptomyces sporangiiformans TaxID=2315329 RepID=A0A505DF46_9ACTN|nr:hypothetical protein FGD71_016420 [Streptomyces sporangiiformans]